MSTVPLRNSWTPLASQVEVLDPDHLLSIHSNAPRCVTFALSPSHIDRDSTEYRRGQRGRPPNECTLHPTNPLIHINKMKEGVLNGTIPLAVSDTSATLSAFLKKDPSRTTGELSTTVFHLPDGAIAPATTRNKLLHNGVNLHAASTLFQHWLILPSSAPTNLPRQDIPSSMTKMS